MATSLVVDLLVFAFVKEHLAFNDRNWPRAVYQRRTATETKQSLMSSFFNCLVRLRINFAGCTGTEKYLKRYSDGYTNTNPKGQASRRKADATSDRDGNWKHAGGLYGTFASKFHVLRLCHTSS